MLKSGACMALFAVALSGCVEAETKSTKAVEPKAISAAGLKVFQSACMSCHSAEGKPTEQGPPIFAVKDHVIKALPERDAFIERVKTWVKDPKADNALMPGAVSKFGLMPAQTNVSDEELQAVAEFLYDTDLAQPDWYAEHYQAEHGTQPDLKP